LAEAKEQRDQEEKEFQQSQVDDQNAIDIVNKAITVLKDNQKAMQDENEKFGATVENLKSSTNEEDVKSVTGFVQVGSFDEAAPVPKAGEKLPPPPPTMEYDEGSHDGEGKGVVAVLTMIAQDIEKDKAQSFEDNKQAKAEYEENKAQQEKARAEQSTLADNASREADLAMAEAGKQAASISTDKAQLEQTRANLETKWEGKGKGKGKAGNAPPAGAAFAGAAFE